MEAHGRHDISDKIWALLEPHLPGRAGGWGGVAKDNRLFINAVFWILRTGAPWRDLPPDYGDWKNTHRGFCRWRDKGIWEKLLEQLVDDPDFEWLWMPPMSRFIKTQRGREVKIKRWVSQKGGNTKIHLAVDAHGMPVRILVTSGTTADCTQAIKLV